jgi:Fe-S cluster assembly protein SufD
MGAGEDRAVSALLDSLAEGSPPLSPHRRSALERVRAAGLPTQRNERWKYTSLRALNARRFAPAATHAEASLDPAVLAGIDGPRLVFVNGVYSPQLSGPASPAGVLMGFVRGEDEERASESYLRADEAFAALNLALAEGGARVHVAADTHADTPVHLVFIGAPAAGDLASHQAHRIHVEAGACLTLVEHHLASGEHRHLDNQLIAVELGAGAKLLHARVQDAAEGATLFARTDVRVAQGAQYRRVDLELGAALSRHELNVDLVGRGARFQSSGALMAGGRRHVDTRLGVRHVAGDTSCELLWRGLAAERGKLSFHGGIEIEAGADGSDASLSNKNLLLSANAEIDTQPVLLIHADEVKAAHGATVGRLDERSLFYLRSRGIPLARARVLLTHAFLREVLPAADAPALVEALSPRLEARLAMLESLA